MATEGAEVEAGFPLADDVTSVPELMQGLQDLVNDLRWRVACLLLADLAEHPGKDDVRAARSITDAYLQEMTALGSVVSLMYSMPASSQEDAVGEAVNHLTVRSNVAETDPRLEAITLAIRGADETKRSARKTM